MGRLDLHHYYERDLGPFRNLSDLPAAEAEAVQQRLRERGDVFASQRSPDYLSIRRGLEQRARALFADKGGRPVRERPHYMTLGACPWLLDWYRRGQELTIGLDRFDPAAISFTYGDLFPAMRLAGQRPYWGQVYTLDEIRAVIEEHGLPQEWNADGAGGPERYIEAQIWDDAPLAGHLAMTAQAQV
ncbi:hypothetical protein O1R50_16355 [Glycomyces luteolus]|uniref:Uncharacterized protein n=1 Tax=Glycomyces luteolus TaxID=2670330 RepID=A0A9X3PM51_9ACTN|nr:hypothetical protein [Glycomyces luteolus]MDA1361205.1 hypothetical protein [Glycomyces luteolus]